MKKYLLIMLGVMAIMLTACGCGNQTETVEKETSFYEIDQTLDKLEEMNNDIWEDISDLYTETLKEIYGDDFDVNELQMVDENRVSYHGKVVSVDYIEEMAYNNTENEW